MLMIPALRGACLVYEPIVSVGRRLLWTSTAWAKRHPKLSQVLELAVGKPCSKWTFFAGDNADFVARAARDKNLIGLTTSEEYSKFPANFLNVHTCMRFLEMACKLSPMSQLCVTSGK